jgi:hypothetical protein
VISNTYLSHTPIRAGAEIPTEGFKAFVGTNTYINELIDLINMINTYEYKNDSEYDINLKGIHDISYELNQLDKMIGMTVGFKAFVGTNTYKYTQE